MGLFGKSKHQLYEEDMAILSGAIQLMNETIKLFDDSDDESKDKYVKKLSDMNMTIRSFEAFGEKSVINADKKMVDTVKKLKATLIANGFVINRDVKAALTALQDLINLRNDE